ncbi:NADPH:quinone oxidoreductase family protein [Mesobacillus maritimus]|uniref:quinone oxidoreductase family protein n=1 Tax=Mesobacillus maritimus TaxID=1643336 RepID=UPI00203D856C|nr:NADPH:quinone oxidoreductase family protein [Mesobacillus maritimus]MCM3584517.1 NADPH:quinone oxidoreductase family protein [Mesobacillus maritimus]
MKAVYVSQFGGPEVLEVVDTDIPTVGPSQVLIKVAAASVNFADVKARQGNYHGKGQPPFIPGLDVAGTVTAVGKDVSELHIGDRVISFPREGSYAEYCVADEIVTYPISDEISFDVAAACPVVAVTTYQLLAKVAKLQTGEKVVVHSASGGIGTTAIQMAKILGAGKVIATVGSKEKANVCYQAGADAVLNYRNDTLENEIRSLTDDVGPDVILDPIGGELFEKNLNILAPFGRIVCFGGESASFQTGNLHKTCRSVLGYSLGTHLKERPETLKSSVLQVLEYVQQKHLKLFIGEKFPLQEAIKAHQWMDSRKSTGKILLVP